MIDLYTIDSFANSKTTLKKTSKDNPDGITKKYLTESTMEVIDFDKVKNKYIKQLHVATSPRSCDALYQQPDGYVFVEFKAGHITPNKKYEIWQKTYDTLLIFSDLTHITISELRNDAEFILVYDEEVNQKNNDPELQEKQTTKIQESKSLRQIGKIVSGLANKEIICFGMSFFEKYCFRKVHTYTVKEFEQYISTRAT